MARTLILVIKSTVVSMAHSKIWLFIESHWKKGQHEKFSHLGVYAMESLLPIHSPGNVASEKFGTFKLK